MFWKTNKKFKLPNASLNRRQNNTKKRKWEKKVKQIFTLLEEYEKRDINQARKNSIFFVREKTLLGPRMKEHTINLNKEEVQANLRLMPPTSIKI